jgi:hypothetical protein
MSTLSCDYQKRYAYHYKIFDSQVKWYKNQLEKLDLNFKVRETHRKK